MFNRLKQLKYRRYKNSKIIPSASIDKFTKIGENTYVGDYSIITKSIIGRYCSIGPYVTIGLGEHDIYKISTSSDFYEENVFEELTKDKVVIGNDVWIGTKATILRGVSIGNGAVIGANSVVTKNVPDYAVVVGCPARIIKYRFSEEKINTINNSQWWKYDLETAKQIHNKINSNY